MRIKVCNIFILFQNKFKIILFVYYTLLKLYFQTREELKDALEKEMRDFISCRDLSRTITISWNHIEFEVHYNSLAEEIKIGDYYLRLLLEEDDKDTSGSSFIKKS